MLENLKQLFNTLSKDGFSAGIFISTVVISFTVFYFIMKEPPLPSRPQDEDKDPPRNFTLQQLKPFNGQDDQPIYLALDGTVYDVSEARDFYGPDGVYGMFAGHDVTKAFALNSLEAKDLDDPNVSDLTYSQQESLAGWIEKYKYYKQYPVVGRLIRPPTGLKLTTEELMKHNGTQEVPEGYVDAPIYIAIRKKVYDMSFGGKMFYGPGGPYHFLAGKDGARSLAKMSFDPKDAESRDLSDLDEKQLKVLADWESKFDAKYPIVGNLVN